MLGFPCNQFGKQEPGTPEEILEFARSQYDVTFPMFEKIDVNGDEAAPLYKFLTEAKAGADGEAAIKWNFAKFLIDRNGTVVGRYAPTVTPEQITDDISALLG